MLLIHLEVQNGHFGHWCHIDLVNCLAENSLQKVINTALSSNWEKTWLHCGSTVRCKAVTRILQRYIVGWWCNAGANHFQVIVKVRKWFSCCRLPILSMWLECKFDMVPLWNINTRWCSCPLKEPSNLMLEPLYRRQKNLPNWWAQTGYLMSHGSKNILKKDMKEKLCFSVSMSLRTVLYVFMFQMYWIKGGMQIPKQLHLFLEYYRLSCGQMWWMPTIFRPVFCVDIISVLYLQCFGSKIVKTVPHIFVNQIPLNPMPILNLEIKSYWITTGHRPYRLCIMLDGTEHDTILMK